MKSQLFASFATALALTGVFTSSAEAAGFQFTTNYTAELTGANQSKGNIWLNSVEFDGQTFSDFSLAKDVKIVSNDLWTKGNTGGASADKGDKATVGLKQELLTEEGAVTTLANLNLNSIIDTEDKGSFVIDVMFDKGADNLFIWERGMNSKMDVQALDAEGNLIGNLLNLDSSQWFSAGYSIDTLEISGSQKVSSLGLSLRDFGLSANDSIFGYRVISKGAAYNGPDWKIVGTTASVPEPTAVIGLGLVAGSLVASRRRQKSK
ncbi:MAG: exosortase-dependent surface protein XDP2 [Lyngbya sp.]|nr:exosortase-dependent surface protein XDP2 [Lyngbya sp.]